VTNKLLNRAGEMRVVEARLPFTSYVKKEDINYSPWDSPCTNTQCARWHAYVKVHVPTDTCEPGARSTAGSTSYLKSSKH
jgi:hypothetical protein